MNDLLELIENGWSIQMEKKSWYIVVKAKKGTRLLEYNMDPSHPHKKLILLDTLNTLNNASKG